MIMSNTPARRLLDALLPVLDDLARDLEPHERYRRLLDACHALLPCDAIALLRLDQGHLVPVAARGLLPDVLGRRFALSEQPRLAAILQNTGPLRFAADSPLPDPYDGLVAGLHGHLPIHDCLGCPVWLDDRPWGVLTLDTLDAAPGTSPDLHAVESLARMAAATVKTAERLHHLTQRAAFEHDLAERLRDNASPSASELVGRSAAHRQLMREIDTVASSDLTVLIQGETGTGKELVAQALHARSERCRQPLVIINCAALPENLVESELFGHVRGAFSGAHQDRRGKFELADGGTLLLDEVGELPLVVQAKLLRVLQTGQLQRVGSDRDWHVDVRVLAATNRDLPEAVRTGRFRADLYHRLGVYPLQVPPLRDRGRDVLLLAGYFLEQYRARLGVRNLRLSPTAQEALLGYDWPGNVRELEHLLGRAALKARARDGGSRQILTLDVDLLDLQPAVGAGSTNAPVPSPADPLPSAATPHLTLKSRVDALQRQAIVDALQAHQGNWAASARALGLQPANLHRLARRLDLKAVGSPSSHP